MLEKSKRQQDQVIFYVAIGSALFLLLIYLNSTIFKSDFVLIGVVQEMGTLPSFGLQPFLIYISAKSFYEKKYTVISYSFFSLMISTTTLTTLIISLLAH